MTPPAPLQLDIRPLVDQQRAPLPAILEAVSQLSTQQALVLIAPFEPAPLYDLMGKRGYTHEARKRDDGAWEIRFNPMAATAP